MPLARAPEAVVAGIVQWLSAFGGNVGVTAGVAGEGFAGDFGEADAADLRRGALEAFADDVFPDAHGLEDLRGAIAAEHADAHLRHDLEQAALERGAQVLERLGVGERVDLFLRGLGLRDLVGVAASFDDGLLRGDAELAEDFAHGLEGEIRAHRARAVADEAGHVMHVARLAALADEGDTHPLARADEVVMHGAGDEEHGHRDVRVVDGAVAEDEDAHAAIHRGLGLGADAVHRFLQPVLAFAERPCGIERGGGMVPAFESAQRGEFVLEEDRRFAADEARVFRRLAEKIAPPAEDGVERHHELLADRVDGRIRDLGEELLEIRVEQARLEREHGERRVVAHRADGLRAVAHHGLEDHVDLLGAVAECELALREREDVERLRGLGGCAGGDLLERDDVVL